MGPLKNDKQEEFCQQYMVDHNATQAAIRAGYSEKTARSIGAENLTKPNIHARVRELQAISTAKTELTVTKVLNSMVNILDIGPKDFHEEDGAFIPIESWTPAMNAAVSGTDYNEDGTIKRLTLWNKPAVIGHAGKHLGMYTDKLDITGGLTVNIGNDDADCG